VAVGALRDHVIRAAFLKNIGEGEFFRRGVAKTIHSLQKGFAINNADGIICISENTKKDLLKFYPNVDEEKVKVIYNGVGDKFKRLKKSEEFLINEFAILNVLRLRVRST